MFEKYTEAANKGLEWVVAKQREDGSFPSCKQGMGYYKVPYLFNITGLYSNSYNLLSWIRENYFTEKGNFEGDFPRGTVYESVYTYPNIWIVSGAQKAGEFDIAYKGMNFLKSQQGDAGGFYATLDGQGGKRQELMCTSMGGVAALYTGELDSALKAADLLRLLYEKQPSPEDALYFVYRPDQVLVTDFPQDEATEFVLDLDKDVRQWYFIPGITASFLTLLFKATGQHKYLDLAKNYFEFAFRCSDYQFNYGQVCKVGWGGAMLYSVTGESRYKNIALKVADYFVNTQREDGSWAEDPEAPDYAILDLTAEFTMWLNEIVHFLS